MKILQIAPPVLPISANMKYGGIERVVRDLDDEYVRLGHDSLVAASANSVISGRLIPTLGTNTWKRDGKNAKYDTNISQAADNFEQHSKRCLEVIGIERPDAIHDHTKFITSDAYRDSGLEIPVLTTFHGDYDDRNLTAVDRINEIRKDGINFINAISESQKKIFSHALEMDFVTYNALDVNTYPFSDDKRNYLFSLGKMDRNKGQDTAIKVAKHLGENLVLAGPVHTFRSWIRQYWEEDVNPNIDAFYQDIPTNQVEEFTRYIENSKDQIFYIGELDDAQKKEWFKYSKGFLMPILWNEPFGLVMIESMATGTPVVAYSMGAVPEVVKDGETGYVVDPQNLGGFIEKVEQINNIDPYDCRRHVEDNFHITRQANDYLEIFSQINTAIVKV